MGWGRLEICGAFLWVAFASVGAQSAEGDAADDLLLADDLPMVVTASRYAQPISDAPSAVSIISSEEIRTFGYRTLADVLASVVGFYTSDDRNYVYAGVRGFGISGDYNNRILLLVDGHRINDAAYFGAQIDRSFPLDMRMIERVEVVRGPGSALYGASAVFAVVNVITKRGRDLQGGEVGLDYGSDLAAGGVLAFGRRIESGLEFATFVSGYRSDGKRRLYYPEFDAPETNFGVARDADREDEFDTFASARLGGFAAQIAFGQRDKRIPTAAFGTYFGTNRTQTRDSTGWLHLSYERDLVNDWSLASRAYVDRYYYRGRYVYDYASAPPPFLVDNDDFSTGERAGTELQLAGRLGRRHRLTIGGEAIYNFQIYLRNQDSDPRFVYLNEDIDTFDWGVFLQDEIALDENLQLTLGVRHDQNDLFGGSTNPRVALVYSPRDTTTLKLLYGRAFRAPNAYELLYIGPNYAPPNDLDPETVGTAEGVWEERLAGGVRTVISIFHSRIDDLIELSTRTGGELQFQNRGSVEAYGGEVAGELRWRSGWSGRIGFVAQRADDSRGRRLDNSPRVLGSFALATPLYLEHAQLALDARYIARRTTGKPQDAPGAFVANVTLHLRELLPGVSLSLAARNLFDQRYFDPASEEHVQARIEQNGLTLLATAGARF